MRMTKMGLNALIKSTNADIRIYGENNIPDQPVLYVINHFTRMETFILPYYINKITGKDVLSLAFHDLFGGSFGKFLKELGAIPTNSPDRNKIMIEALLKGNMSCLIFPEGQMIKDKKLVEKGKYMIYNSGIRRPPHTGAAVIAMQAEFYREKLKYFYEIGFENGINEYKQFFDIESDDKLVEIINQQTYILPLNISYYPIRVRKNIVNKIASMFVDELPARIDEELEVEGTMIVDGVDIDINIGEPIPVNPFITEKRRSMKLIHNKSPYLFGDERKRNLSFRKEGIDLMYRYMNSIYQMTTVNYDHIFSYILTRYRKNRIKETNFKNRVYLATDMIKMMDLRSYHTTLKKNQDSLLFDNEHDLYVSFIEAAKAEGTISVEDGYITKERDRFSKVYEFHSIRKDNIVEVLKNEIEPIGDLTRSLNKLMRVPSFLIRKRIKDRFLEIDNTIFNDDYEEFQVDGESRPKEIGCPFLLKNFFQKKGVLLIHGYLAAPEEMRLFADYLNRNGYTTYGVRLRGHGTSPGDLSIRNWEEWNESVKRGYVVLKNSVRKVAIVGFSTGAGLALYNAIINKNAYCCVVSINAPLSLKNISSNLASVVILWNNLLEKMNIQSGRMEFVKNEPENPDINYFSNPISGVRELEKLMKVVDGGLGNLSIPSMVVQGSDDPVVNPESGLEIFKKIGTINKELCRVYSTRHGIIRGEGSEKVFRRIKCFLDENFIRK